MHTFNSGVFIILYTWCSNDSKPTANVPENELDKIDFAGGCFWGVEEYFSQINGVQDVTSGYANGTGEQPSYAELIKGDRGFVEAVEIDPTQYIRPSDKEIKVKLSDDQYKVAVLNDTEHA